MVKQNSMRNMSPGEQVLAIQKAMGMQTFERPSKWWLDLGDPLFNQVMGSRERGMCGGKTCVLTGPQSSGKTLLAAKIAGLAQQAGAIVAWGDAEESFDPRWVKIHGLDPGPAIKTPTGKIIGYEKVALFLPLYGKLGATKKFTKTESRVETAEEYVERMDKWMRLQREIHGPKVKLCVVLDSTTALMSEEDQKAGFMDENMRTKMSAPFINKLTKSWKTLAPHVNAIIIYISQLRTSPGMFSKEYMPGGRGLYFHPHVHVKVIRIQKGKVMQSGVQVGVKSLMINTKNKSGGGSVEGLECGFQTYFHKDKWKFVESPEFKKKEKEKEV